MVTLRSSGRVVPPLGAGRSPTDEFKREQRMTQFILRPLNEMESVKVDGSKYGVDEIFQVEQLDGFKPVKLKSIPDEDLQAFLHKME